MALIPRDRLAALIGRGAPAEDDKRPQRTPLPRLDQVLYAGPNPDGTRKRCGSCWKWVTDGTCLEVAGEINAGAVCGYNVFGKPQPVALLTEALMPKMTAADAGLIGTPSGEGTSCDICRFFTPDDGDSSAGLCEAVGSVDGLPPVVVDSRGCCSRWEHGGPARSVGPAGTFRAADRQTTRGGAFNGGDRSA